MVSCLDVENSKITESDTGRVFVTYFSIDPQKTRGLKLFRFYDRARLAIINEELKNQLSTMGFESVSFQNTKDYDRKY